MCNKWGGLNQTEQRFGSADQVGICSYLMPSLFRVVFGNSNGLAVVDYFQKTLLMNVGVQELYGSADPFQRQPRSPRKTRQPSGGESRSGGASIRSRTGLH